MSPASVSLSIPAPPTPSVSQDTTGASGSDPANQPARSFRQVLDDQSASSAPQQTSSAAAPPADKPRGAQNADETADAKDSAKKTDEGNPDLQGAEGAEQAGKAAGDKSTVATAKSSAGTKKQSSKVSNGAGSPVHPTEHETGADTAQALPADEQPATPADEKQGGNGKPKNAKAATAATVADAASVAALPAAAAASGPTATTSTSSSSERKTDSPEVSQAAEKSGAASGAAEKSTAKPDLHAEESDQSAKQSSSSTAQKTKGVASGKSDGSDATTSTQTTSSDATVSADASAKTSDHTAIKGDFAAVSQQLADAGTAQKATDAPKAPVTQPAVVPAPTAADFAAANHAQIVNSVHTQLLPNGGTMRLRLDPPDLGAMQVTVRMRDGVMSAEFQTSNDQAAKLLSHSLGDLKTQLESQGMSVDKLHVTSAPQESRGKGGESDSGQQREQTPSDEQRREQQRKEMLRRMWSKLAKGNAPLDMVA
jgi:flagellar hook-length control protein FliK